MPGLIPYSLNLTVIRIGDYDGSSSLLFFGLVDGKVHRRRSRSLGATTVGAAGNSGISDGYRHGSCGRNRCRLNRGRELGGAHPRSDLGHAIEIYGCTGGKVGAIDFKGDCRAAGDRVIRNESGDSGHRAWLNRSGGLGVSAADG